MKRIAGLLLCLFVFSVAGRAGGYAIRNYLPKEYGGFNQMWDAAQDKTGLMFFACTSNIFIYDGQSWDKVPVKQGGATRRIFLDTLSNTIYVSTVSDFGYLQCAFNGKWTYVSLLPEIPKVAAEFTDIWEIHQQGENIFFQASERIFIFKRATLQGIIEPPDENKQFALSFSANGRLFVRQRNVGMNEIRNGKLQLLPGGEQFANVRVLGIIPWKDKSNLVITGDQGFVIMNPTADPNTGSCFSEFPLPPDDFLTGAGVLGGEWLNDSLFGLNSRSGIGVYNRAGKLTGVLNKETGLTDESIAGLFVDREKNLWVMHNNGLSRVALNSPARYFNDKSGINGSVEMCLEYNGSLHLATTQGIFYDPGNSGQFQPLDFPKVEVWALLDNRGDLLAATTTGLMRVKNQELLIAREMNRIISTPIPGELITAEKGGIGYFRLEPFGKPVDPVHIPLNDDLIRLSSVDTVSGKPELREFWCASRFNELLHITLNVADGTADVQRYDESDGWDDEADFMVRIADSTYFFRNDSAFRYIPANDKPGGKCFAPAPDIFSLLENGDLSQVKLPFDYHLFLNKKALETSVFGLDSSGKLIRSKVIANYFSGQGVNFGWVNTSGMAWMMSNDLLVRINPAIPTNRDVPFSTLIRRVVLGEDSVIFFGSDKTSFSKDTALPFRYNSISFRYHAPFFDQEEHLTFSYMLEGYDTTWSKWSRQTVKDYTNLSEGSYTFTVKARNTYGTESAISSYSFTILPPWYRTGYAYTLYGIGFVVSIFASVRLSARHLRRQKEKLEQVVTERTAEVVQQKQQIEVQNRELETAYKGMRDSIHYAQRIQDAILPVQSDIRQALPESFMLFRPRDIVSGDFYWFIRGEKKTFVACVDCTGHGVPGAFMSMVGNTLLNEIVLEKKVEAADEILNLLHLRVRQALRQDTGGETRDGMDIALCVIDHAKRTMQFAGANRPLWLIRSGELIQYRPDKLSIAGEQLEQDRRFTRHNITLAKGDCIYLSSDGYADQFGGERGKKFMAKRFQSLLKEIHALPMDAQMERLSNAFDSWKGNLEQVDDVLVIGFRYLD